MSVADVRDFDFATKESCRALYESLTPWLEVYGAPEPGNYEPIGFKGPDQIPVRREGLYYSYDISGYVVAAVLPEVAERLGVDRLLHLSYAPSYYELAEDAAIPGSAWRSSASLEVRIERDRDGLTPSESLYVRGPDDDDAWSTNRLPDLSHTGVGYENDTREAADVIADVIKGMTTAHDIGANLMTVGECAAFTLVAKNIDRLYAAQGAA